MKPLGARRFSYLTWLLVSWSLCIAGPVAPQELETHTYAWSPLERIASITTPHGTTTYEYDADGLRVRKDSPRETVIYVRDGAGNILAEYDAAGNLLCEYVYAGGRRLAKIGADGGSRLYYHSDMVGTPLAITNEDGELAWRGESLPFGEEHSSTGDLDGKRFTGKERDEESGLYDFEARYYDATIGRFPSVDEVAGIAMRPQSWNRYAYAFNNPLRLVDGDGRAPSEAETQQVLEVRDQLRNLGRAISFIHDFRQVLFTEEAAELGVWWLNREFEAFTQDETRMFFFATGFIDGGPETALSSSLISPEDLSSLPGEFQRAYAAGNQLGGIHASFTTNGMAGNAFVPIVGPLMSARSGDLSASSGGLFRLRYEAMSTRPSPCIDREEHRASLLTCCCSPMKAAGR